MVMRWNALLLSLLLLAGCGAGSARTVSPPLAPPALEMQKTQPAYQPVQPLVDEQSQGFSFKRPTDWKRELQTQGYDVFVFGAQPGVASASLGISRINPTEAGKRWPGLGQPFAADKVRAAWLAEQQADPLHHWKTVSEGAATVAGIAGYRFEMTGGSDPFRADQVAYLLVQPEQVVTLVVLQQEPRPTFNQQRWTAIARALDDLVPTVAAAK